MLHRFFVIALLSVAAPAAASPMQSLVLPSLEYVAGKKAAIKESTVRLGEVSGRKAFVLLYWNPSVKHSVEELKRFDVMVRERRKLAPADDIVFLSATRVISDEERAAVETVIRENRLVVPTLVDRNLGVATGIDAQYIPAYYGENRAGDVALASYGSLAERMPIWGTLEIALRVARGDLPALLKPTPVPLKEGSTAPQFALADLDGRLIKLEDFLRKDKNTLVIFWSVFCSHCQRELPRIQAYLRERPGVYEVVSVTRMLNPEDFVATRDFVQRGGFAFPVLNDGGQVMLEYQIKGFPTWMVLDPAGKILTIQSGERNGLEGLLRKFEK